MKTMKLSNLVSLQSSFQNKLKPLMLPKGLSLYYSEEVSVVEEISDLPEVIKSAPVAKIVSVIIRHAVDGGASDIHIEPKHKEGRVRYRVDGVLHTTITLPDYLYNSVVSRIKVMANLKLDETRKPQDGRIRMKINGQEIDLRVSVFPMLNAEKVVMRVLDTSAGVPKLAELGFSDYHIKIIERNIEADTIEHMMTYFWHVNFERIADGTRD